MDTGNTIYYMKLPVLEAAGEVKDGNASPYFAQGIIPVLKERLDTESFQLLYEAAYLTVRTKTTPFLRAGIMDVKKVEDIADAPSTFDTSPNKTPEKAFGEYVNKIADFLTEYVTRNEGKLKVIALYNNPRGENEEETVLKAAVKRLTPQFKLEEIL